MRILLVQTAFIGDCILSLPVISALVDQYPTAEIYVLTSNRGKEIFESHKSVKQVIIFNKTGLFEIFKSAKVLKNLSFSKVFSLHKSARTSILLYLSRIPERVGFKQAKFSSLYTKTINRVNGVHDVVRNLSLIIDPISEEKATNYQFGISVAKPTELSESVNKILESKEDYILCFPGSVWKTKQLDPLIYREILTELANRNEKIIVVGGPAEIKVSEIVSKNLTITNLAGKTKLKDIIALVSQAKLILCNDSMALQLASAFKRKTVVFFCATILEFGFGPWNNPNAIVIEKKELWCRPCGRHGGNFCHTGSNLCRKEFDIPDILSRIGLLLSK